VVVAAPADTAWSLLRHAEDRNHERLRRCAGL